MAKSNVQRQNECDSYRSGIYELERQREQLVEALKYARRFLNDLEHDTEFVDRAIAQGIGLPSTD